VLLLSPLAALGHADMPSCCSWLIVVFSFKCRVLRLLSPLDVLHSGVVAVNVDVDAASTATFLHLFLQ